MPRARNKEELLNFSEENYSKLMKMISDMTENQMTTEFDFSGGRALRIWLHIL